MTKPADIFRCNVPQLPNICFLDTLWNAFQGGNDFLVVVAIAQVFELQRYNSESPIL